MKLVKMVRTSPELPGGPTSCDIQVQDMGTLEARGWIQEGKEFNAGEPAVDKKEALVQKAILLKETNPKAVKAAPSQIPLMSVEKLTALIEEAEAVIASQDEE